MFGKIIGAVVGSKMASSASAIGGSGGAILGIGAASLARRMSIPALVVLGAGGYFFKKHMEKKEAAEADTRMPPKVKSSAM